MRAAAANEEARNNPTGPIRAGGQGQKSAPPEWFIKKSPQDRISSPRGGAVFVVVGVLSA